MVNFNLMLYLLCAFSCISSSLAQFYNVQVQPGKDVTLQCSNFSNLPIHIYWFKLTSSNASCISTMSGFGGNANFCEGFQNDKFNMTSNTSWLFLEIKQVDFSDSGLYFCGESKHIMPKNLSATYLEVQEDRMKNLTSVILGSFIVFLLLVIIGLVRFGAFYTGERRNQQHSENVDSDTMNYAALNFHPKAKIRRPAPQREMEQNVVYAATR